ncbi:MAG: ROK family protein [Armatimonadetes bacterium]|nr:ROK family protein [Armatimonadota bacterium]
MAGKIDHKRMKNSNKAVILDLIRREGCSSRQEMIGQTSLSAGAVSMLVEELIADGWLVEEKTFPAPRQRTGSGRHRVPIKLNPGSAYIIGCEADSDRVEGILIDITEKKRGWCERLAADVFDAGQVIEHLQSIILCLLDKAPERDRVRGIAVSVPGYVDRDAGVGVQCSRVPGWRDIPVRRILEGRFGLPVEIDNTARMRALAETRYGLGQETRNLMYIHVGPGIGAGMIFGGRLFRGASGSGGEIGHMIISPHGPVCSCGNRGCLQAVASIPAIERKARETLHRDILTRMADLSEGNASSLHFPQIVQAAREGDKVALTLVEEAAVALGLSVTNTVHLLNPEVVVLGGPITLLGSLLLETVRRVVRTHAIWETSFALKIEMSCLEEDIGARGAAALGLETLLHTEFPNGVER